MKKLFESGFWEEINLPQGTTQTTDSSNDHGREHADTADSRTPDVHTDDSVYTIYECHVDLDAGIRSGEIPTASTATRTSLPLSWKHVSLCLSVATGRKTTHGC